MKAKYCTKINMEYLPEVREDTIESNDPQLIERLTHSRDIVKEDRVRFNKLCRDAGFDFKKCIKEYEERQETIRQLREELASVTIDIRTAERRHWHVKLKRLEEMAEQLKKNIYRAEESNGGIDYENREFGQGENTW